MSRKYEELIELLKKDIADSIACGISKLPTEMQLCKQYRVSRTTVSRALLILEQEKLIYKKQGSGSYITGLLPEDSGNKVSILLTSDSEYIFPALLDDLDTLLTKEGYLVSVHITHNRADTERDILQKLISNPPRGLIAEPSRSALPTPNYDLYEELSAKGTNTVFFHGCYSNLPPSLYVKDDNFAGGFLLGELLLKHNHRQIAGIFQLDTIQGQERHLGFLRSMLEAGVPIDEDMVSWFTTEQLSRLQQKQDTRFLSHFVMQLPKSCTAIICHNDEIAYWLIKELSYSNIRVPEDVSIVSFDNSYLSELSVPRLTSLSHKPHETATAAVSLLTQKLLGQNPVSMQLPWHLVERSSTLWRAT